MAPQAASHNVSPPGSSIDPGMNLPNRDAGRRVTFMEAPPKLERVLSAEEWPLEGNGNDMDDPETPLHHDHEKHNNGDRKERWTRLGGSCFGPCFCGPDLENGHLNDESSKRSWSRQQSQESIGSLRESLSGRGNSPRGSWLRQQISSPVLVTRMVMMGLLVIVTVVLSLGTWYATGIAYNNAVNEIADRLRGHITNQTVEHFSCYLSRARGLTAIYASVLETALKPSTTTNTSLFSPVELNQTVAPLAWSFFKEATEHATSLGYVQVDGSIITYSNTRGRDTTRPTGVSLVFSNGTKTTGSERLAWYMQEVSNTTGKVLESTPAAGIQALLNTSDVYIRETFGFDVSEKVGWNYFVSENGPILLSGKGITSREGANLSGASVVVSDIKQLSTYLSTYSSTQPGATIYVEHIKGYLVAASSNVTSYLNNSGTIVLLNTTEVQDPIISAAAMYLKTKFGSAHLFKNQLALESVKIDGRKSYINSSPLSIDNLTMLVVVIVERDSIIGHIDSDRKKVLIIESLCAVSVLILGWAVIIFVTFYVSMRMRPKEELLRQQEETQRAQAASEVKSQFLANISHDLRTPMAGILGLLDIMLCDRLTAEQEANLRQMKSCAASLLGLLNNLLDLAKVEAGKMQLEVLEFDIVGELESLVDMFSVQGLSNGTEIALDLSDDIERTVKGDPSRVRQVFANLLSNACKFTKEGHVLVRGWMQRSPPLHLVDRTPRYVDEFRESDGKRRITYIFEVDDTGPGIPPHKRDLVFEKFQQADLSTTRTHGGTGLGLGIVRSLVKLMGGGIAVVDKDGPGACFRFDLTFECLDQTSKWKNSIVQPEFLLPKLSSVEGGQVLLAMKESSAGAVIATGWMERRGLHVWRVTQWEDILPAVSSMVAHRANGARGSRSLIGFSAPLDRKPSRGTGLMSAFSGPLLHSGNSRQPAAPDSPRGIGQLSRFGASHEEPVLRSPGLLSEDMGEPPRLILAIIDAALIPNPFQFLAEELHIFRARLQAQGVVIAWLVEHNTTAETRRALRRSGCAVASKPLYASRMAPLLALATARKGIPHTASSIDPPQPQGGSLAEMWQAEAAQSFMLPGPVEESEDKLADPELLGRTSEAVSTSKESLSPTPDPAPGRLDARPPLRVRPASGLAGFSGERDITAASASVGPDNIDSASPSGSAPVGSQTRLPSRTRNFSVPKKSMGSGSPEGSFNLALKGLHVLIAEDTPLLKKVAVIRMQKLGCTVVAVSDGKEAADLVLASYRTAVQGLPSDDKMFDAILMDCQMPIMDGYGATQAIREAEKDTPFHTPIIALTAHAMTSDERKCLDAGMDAYLTKPIDPVLMASTILNLVRPGKDNSGNSEDSADDEDDDLLSVPPVNGGVIGGPPQQVGISRRSLEDPGRLEKIQTDLHPKERYLGKT